MKDKGLQKKLVADFETSNRRTKGAFFGFRKMFWDYLKKLHVPFFDACCEDASEDSNIVPVGFDIENGVVVYWDSVSESWLDIADWVTTTTTTTTSTTTTTTAP